MGIRIPGSAVSAVAGAVEREASLALRAVQQSWSAAPKRAPVRSATPVKDWSVPILLGGAGLTYLSSPSGDSSIFSSLFGPSAPTSPPSNAPITARPTDAPNTAADTDGARVSAMLSDISTRRFSGVQVDTGDASSRGETFLPLPMSLQKLSPAQQKAIATRPLNYFDKFDNETEYWSGKPEDLPANFDERFSAAQ
jgi:hypothetical protein